MYNMFKIYLYVPWYIIIVYCVCIILYIYMYVCIYIYMYVYIYICMYIYMYVYIYMYTNMLFLTTKKRESNDQYVGNTLTINNGG